MAIDTNVPNPVANFATNYASTPYLFVAAPMKLRSAPKAVDSTLMVQAGKTNDLEVIDPGVSVKWISASWETGKELKDAKVGDVDRLYVLIGDDPADPWGWVCLYEEYKTKDPDETMLVEWGGLTANDPPTAAELSAAQAKLNKQKDELDKFLKAIGKTGKNDSTKKGNASKAAVGFGTVALGLGVGWLLYNASKK